MRSSPPRQTIGELRKLQRLAGAAIMRPLGPGDQMQTQWIDGTDTASFVSDFIKPNDRLTSFERIEIYNRQYWYRLIDAVYEDYPGLLAILGQEKFSRLARAYLEEYPSRSFSLRNLGGKLPKFLADHPQWGRPHEQMALDMARFEWAQVVAFDGPAEPRLVPDDLLGRDPKRLRLRLQPYLMLLDMAYPLDKFTLALKKTGLRSEASNAMSEESHAAPKRRVRLPRKKRTFVAVHRHENDIYFKLLEPAAHTLLEALNRGRTLAQACELAGEVAPRKINAWFANWAALGWFCKPLSRKNHE
jgi:Putative DNA-binding domain